MRILWLILALTTCAHAPRKPAQIVERKPEIDGAWTPLVKLKDLTLTYPGDSHDWPRPTDGWWVTPIQANLLGNGRMLITGWSRSTEKSCGAHKGRQNGTTWELNLADIDVSESKTLAITPIAESPRDKRDVLYCAGAVPFPDGRILYTGGARYDALEISGQEQEYGLNYARVFDPLRMRFLQVDATSPAGPHPTSAQLANDWKWYEQGMMWYPTNTRLPGGKQLVAGGFAQQNGPGEPEFFNKSLAVFDTHAYDQQKNPWSVLVSHEAATNAMNIGPFDYPHSYLLYSPLMAGGMKRQLLTWGGQNGQIAFVNLDPGVTESERMYEPRNGKRPDAANASDKTSLLLPNGEIFVMGGGANGTREGQRIDVYSPANDSWRSVDTGITRIRPASTLLPTGEVLVLNGEGMWDGGGPSVGDRRQPTLFDPLTMKATNLAAWSDDPLDRGYHNLSLLLKDGRILVGGGRTLDKTDGVEEYRIGCERPDIRIFSPPYLFRGPRPVIQDVSDGRVLALGQRNFSFRYDGPALKVKGGVVLMAMGAETHHFDQNQRYIALDFYQRGQNIIARTPRNSWAAPEGQYLLFLVTENGVPSVAKTVQVTQ